MKKFSNNLFNILLAISIIVGCIVIYLDTKSLMLSLYIFILFGIVYSNYWLVNKRLDSISDLTHACSDAVLIIYKMLAKESKK